MAKKYEHGKKAYSKAQILQSKQFTVQQRDVLKALLRDDSIYAKNEVVTILDEFLAKEAK